MLTAVFCNGYKAFASPTRMPLRAINVVFGRNNVGKTGLVRLPLFVSASLVQDDRMYALASRGVRFGASFSELASSDQPHPAITFGLSWGDNAGLGLRLQYLSRPDSSSTIHITAINIDGVTTSFALDADARGGTAEWILAQLPTDALRELVRRRRREMVDIHSRSTHIPSSRPPILSTYEVRPARHWSSGEVPYLLAADRQLLASVSEWYLQHMGRVSIDVDRTSFAFRLTSSSPGRTTAVNLAESGRGTQAALGVVTHLLAAVEELHVPGLLVIEEPEAHVHPSAHGALADLAIRASEKSQVIVETHSENFILRLRRRIAENQISNSELALYFVDEENSITEIEVRSDGTTSDWPTGVFEYDIEEAEAIVAAKLASLEQE